MADNLHIVYCLLISSNNHHNYLVGSIKLKAKTLILMITTLLMITILSACASKPKDERTGLYLRSEFTWWEAQRAYEFKIKPDGQSYLIATIVPDGNKYHLKIADKAWSADLNCGPTDVRDTELKLDEWLPLNCQYDAQKNKITPLNNAFTFKPKVAGEFKFSLKFANKKPIKLLVSKVN
jgi:hypothetical protein